MPADGEGRACLLFRVWLVLGFVLVALVVK